MEEIGSTSQGALWPSGDLPPHLMSSLSLWTCIYFGGGTMVHHRPPHSIPQRLSHEVSPELSPSFPSDGYTEAPAPD